MLAVQNMLENLSRVLLIPTETETKEGAMSWSVFYRVYTLVEAYNV